MSSTIVFRPLMISSTGERKRRFFASGSLALIIPVWFGSALLAWHLGRLHEAAVSGACILVLLSCWACLTQSARPWLWLRLHLVVLLMIGFYRIAHHHMDGYAFSWLYLVPMATFFLFGHREGLAWAVGVGSASGALMLSDFGFSTYPLPVVARFLTSYAITSMLAFEIEWVRYRYALRLRREKKALKRTLADIEMLRGFLPICASCKSIRDDRGYWSSLELYLSQHSMAQVTTSSLCPNCRAASQIDKNEESATLPSYQLGTEDLVLMEGRVSSSPATQPRFRNLRQRRYLNICLGSVAIVGFAYGTGGFLQGELIESGIEMGVGLACSIGLVLAPRIHNLRPLSHAFAILLSLFIFFELTTGGASGQAFLWSLVMPPIFFTLFGRQQGAYWNLFFLIGHSTIFLFPLMHDYYPPTAVRLTAILILMTLMALGLERSRDGLRNQLQQEKSEVEQALAHAKTLHGILPLCPRCKNIRDDDGFWKQVEDYLGEHAGTQLSHGLCPHCSERHFDLLDTLPSSTPP